MAHLDRKASEHTISVQLPDDLLMADMDARLIVQVVINIVNNAIKYTPPGSHIQLSARRQGDNILVEVADDGPGIPDEAKAKLFEMFYTAGNDRGDSRRGWLGPFPMQIHYPCPRRGNPRPDNLPKGCRFTFTLHSSEVNPHE